jgi:hypothetical protein
MVFVKSAQVVQHHRKMDLHAQLARLTKSLSTDSVPANQDMLTTKLISVLYALP